MYSLTLRERQPRSDSVLLTPLVGKSQAADPSDITSTLAALSLLVDKHMSEERKGNFYRPEYFVQSLDGREFVHGVVWVPKHMLKENDKSYVGGLRSQLKPAYWEVELNKETDRELAEYICNGVQQGFKIVANNANIPEYIRDNYGSVLHGESATFVNDLIISELSQGKYVFADYKPVCVHALGAVRKKSGAFRPTTDCKRPLLYSINNFMETTFQTFKYHSSDSVCNLMTPSCFMATVDIANAYRTIPIHPEDWKYQGIVWKVENEQRFFYDTRLCFGLKCAPFIFTKIAEFIANCMSRKGYTIVYYIDDFWIYGDTFEDCRRAEIELIVLLGRLGYAVSGGKCTSP